MDNKKIIHSLADLKGNIPKESLEGTDDTTDPNNIPSPEENAQQTELVEQDNPEEKFKAIQELKNKLKISDYETDDFYQVYENTGQFIENSNQENEKEITPETIMVGYIAGCQAQRDFLNKENSRYLDGDETNFLLLVNESDISPNNKIYYLMQIHERVLERKKNEQRPRTQMNRQSFEDIKICLKTDYIMGLNEMIKNHIDSVQGRDNHIISLKRKLLNSVYIPSLDKFSSFTKGLPILESVYSSQITKKENWTNVERLISGMRHEVAFEEFISEIDPSSEVFGIIPTTRKMDAEGVDLTLSVKLSTKINNDGSYRYATTEEIANGEFIVKDLPIDLKSTKDAAENALNKQKERKVMNHWVMWSHIYSQDFRLSYNGDDGVGMDYTNDEAPIYLKPEQHEAMRRLDRSSIMYFDNKKKQEFSPESTSTRVEMIRREILKGINYLNKNQIEKSA